MTSHAGRETEMRDLNDLRRLSFAIAYRMLGSVADAEDVVQEALLRLHRARDEGTAVESPKSYLAAITTRVAIDHLRSARVRRESYVGSWLPEPVISEEHNDAASHVELAESLSMAFLTILEILSPVERAVFLLREAFDYSYDEISQVIGKSEENCRQIFARAARHLEANRPRFESSPKKRQELAAQFFSACENGDLSGLLNLLAEDVIFQSDGGGKVIATLRPVEGNDRVARFLHGLFTKVAERNCRLQRVEVNGQPGAIVFDGQNKLLNAMALDIVDGKIAYIRAVVNPDKLRHLGPPSDLLRIPERN